MIATAPAVTLDRLPALMARDQEPASYLPLTGKHACFYYAPTVTARLRVVRGDDQLWTGRITLRDATGHEFMMRACRVACHEANALLGEVVHVRFEYSTRRGIVENANDPPSWGVARVFPVSE